MDTTRPNYVPVGTIIAYGGEIKDRKENLEESGWLLCEGGELKIDAYEELFDAIQWSWGKPSDTSFRLPDFRGLFVRGVTGSSDTDPDVMTRTSITAGGNDKNQVGSFQQYATGKPKNPFTATIPNNNIKTTKFDGGSSSDRSGNVTASSNKLGYTKGGGDNETRPKNKYVYYLIKHTSLDKSSDEVKLPIGAIIPFAGKPIPQIKNRFMLCDGDAIQNVGKWKLLFDAIDYVHGKTSDGKFNLPDYRGYFLRGVESSNTNVFTPRDPDATERTAPFPERPEGERGNDKDQVGSVQNDATAYPVNNEHFATSINNLPSEISNKSTSVTGPDLFKWNDTLVEADVTENGGDPETRPVHFNLDWYIKFL